MIDIATLVFGAGSAVGVAALLATDPIVIRKAYVPMVVEYYQGYNGTLISKLLREKIRMIAREAGTSRGDQLGVFNADESAIDILADRLYVDGLVDSLREFLNLQAYSLDPYLVDSGHGLKMGLKGETAHGELFYLSVAGTYDDIPGMLEKLAQRFVERVDPYVLTLYYFRTEYAKGEFTQSLPMIEHTVRVSVTKQRVWPLLLWGRMHYRLGEYDKAIERYQEALKVDPDFALATARWGEALLGKGDLKGGLEKMQEAITVLDRESVTPPQRAAMAAPLHVLLGDTLVKLGAEEEARDVYVRGLHENADNALLQTSLGSLYLRHRQFEPAVDLLQKALMSHPNPAVPRKLLDQALAAEAAS